MSRTLAQDLPRPARPASATPVAAVVALGANLGDRAATLEQAVTEIARLPLVDEVRVSDPVESVAVTLEGPSDTAPAYLNAVALVTTRLAPSVLLGMLHAIESAHGRTRRVRWGDRTLDLDLIAYGDVVSSEAGLLLPHPRAAEREFVLAPWLAIDADAVLPGRGRVADLLARLRSTSEAPEARA
ncbi:2-amino-4-hydroxy-6-hydroxymethyldihydropteridine diphosphokinase [Microbacterium sp. LRZ72]|uniref:2-amino-4-hydroxy-6- hydroxymethyldihydropteridine diphosphokinase n=1 Tax=Microbacterium sp. LRZ72 TaxID=2942481 RepID=UPI0029B31AFE|nr:2-amino-4-hydroxy-6-hydroxymethyldihydropteridine diphosphokinase [Microbacterium sp. LRZ72]MDX2377833.1 2-amino-4-hydroxy-6-hydroxymethyldihydropteridine diphosphokinase [Microbacterium sp. LRZ72]